MTDASKPEPAPPAKRSDRFVLSSQLEAFCISLRLAVQTKDKPGNTSVALLKKFREDIFAIVIGRAKNNLPEIEDGISTIDMLAIAETLRGTIGAFLTREEAEEQRGSLGFKSGGG